MQENKSLLPSYLYDLKLGANAFPGYDRHMWYVPKEFKADAEKDKNIILGDFVHYSCEVDVSYHQFLFPSMMYVCHHVSNVRIYHAEIMDLKWKFVINNDVAICHLNTTSWSSHHVAFQILGFGPGKIEVSHWFYEKDHAWTVAT
ncbi:hypothetical protein RYX36_011710 [Vicia faba]